MSVSKDPVRGTYYVQCWFEDFSWEGIEFPADFSREELLSCGFVDRKENVVLYGGSGNGKTHTAVALGLIACSQGRRMLFKETSKLILELSAAHREGGLKQKLVIVSSSGFQLRQRFFSHVARKGFRFGKGVPLSLFGFAS